MYSYTQKWLQQQSHLKVYNRIVCVLIVSSPIRLYGCCSLIFVPQYELRNLAENMSELIVITAVGEEALELT